MIIQAVSVVTNASKAQSALKKISDFISGLICRVESPCGAKLQAAAARLGIQGYRLTRGSDWWYFLPTGENITWNPPEKDGQPGVYGVSAQTWYALSGLNERMRNEGGVSNCCAKSKWPPSEFFPVAGTFEGLKNVVIDGVQISWDAKKFNEAAVREAIKTQLSAQRGGSGGSGGDTLPQPSNAGLTGIGALAALAYFFLRK